MSFMHFDATSSTADQLGIVTLSGGTATDHDSFFAQAGFDFRSDGTVFKRIGYSYSQISSLTDWIFPRDNFDGSDYEIRAHQILGGISLIGTQDTWFPLSSNRLWYATCLRFCVDSGSFYADIRWQDGTNMVINNSTSLHDGAPVMASALYNINLEAN